MTIYTDWLILEFYPRYPHRPFCRFATCLPFLPALGLQLDTVL